MAGPFITMRRQVAAAIEAVEGTPEVLVAGDLIHPSWDASWTPDIPMGDRTPVQPSLSKEKKVAGTRMAEISFKTELKGSGAAGTVPPHLSVLLQACGWGETIVVATSVTYAPASAGIPSITLEIREGDGDANFKIKQIAGARGNVKWTTTVGENIIFEFTFKGVYVEPTDGAALATPADAVCPEPFLSTAFTFAGVSVKISTFTFDMGNQLSPRADPNTASGWLSVVITDRRPIGTIDPEASLVATINFPDLWTTNTTGILTFTLGATAGNIATVTFPEAQIMSAPDGDREGFRTKAIELQFNKSAAAGDDEASLALT